MKVIIEGAWTTKTEYELQYYRKTDRFCYSAFPCDERGNLLTEGAESWGKNYLLVKGSPDYIGPELVRRPRTQKEKDLIECDCNTLFLAIPDRHGHVFCPACHKEFKASPRVEQPREKRFYVVRKEAV